MSATGTTDLPEGHLPCLACGVAVPPPHEATEQITWPAITEGAPSVRRPARTITMTRCEPCRATRAKAEVLAAGHRRMVAGIGSPSIAVYHLELALTGLDVLGARLHESTERGARLLLQHMTIPGGLARWATQAESADTCAEARWSFVDHEARAVLRKGYAALLRARVEKPRPVPHPEGGGCLLCGVGAVLGLPSRAHSVWRARTVTPSSLGGRGPERISGYLCPLCESAADAARSVGPSAMEGSLLAYLQVPRRSYAPVELRGLVGWASLGATAEPNETPWQHMGSLEPFRDAAKLPG